MNTQIKYVAQRSIHRNNVVIEAVKGKVTAKQVAVKDRPYVLKCRAVIPLDEWNKLANTPLEAALQWRDWKRKELEFHKRHSLSKLQQCEADLAEAEKFLAEMKPA